jgi:hypothetical protein
MEPPRNFNLKEKRKRNSPQSFLDNSFRKQAKYRKVNNWNA